MNTFNPRGGSRGMSDRGRGRGSRRGGRGRGARGGYNREMSPDRRSGHSDDPGYHRRPQFDQYRTQRLSVSRSPSPMDRNPFDGRNASSTRRDGGRRRERSPEGAYKYRNERSQTPPQPSCSTSQPTAQLPMSKNDIARMWKLKLEDVDEAVRRAEYDLRRARLEKDNTYQAYKEYVQTL